MKTETAARSLGWASLAIGLAELAAPKKLEQAMCIGDGQNTGILRVFGVREILQGVDILTHKDPTCGVLARVAGDALDGVYMAAAARKSRDLRKFTIVAALVGGIVAADIYFAKRLTQKKLST